MAKAKVGGTSAKLRGVVGDFIYQIIRNPKGFTEQKVITYTREKYNRKTKWQALARMQIAMMYYSMDCLLDVITNSFEGIRDRVNSCNRFVQINLPSLQDYCCNHWKEAILCNWPVIGLGIYTYFPFIISEGTYKQPRQFSWVQSRFDEDHPTFRVDLKGTLCRKIDVRKILGFANTDAFNAFYWVVNGFPFIHVNIQMNPKFNDNQVITSANCGEFFTFRWYQKRPFQLTETSVRLRVEFDSTNKILSFTPLVYGTQDGRTSILWIALFSYVFSKRKGNKWLRNTNYMMSVRDQSESGIGGNSPSACFDHYDPNYKGESYNDYFVK